MNPPMLTMALVLTLQGAAPSKLPEAEGLLAKVDVSDPGWGRKTYGPARMDVFEGPEGSVLLAYQSRYGGDGDHTENRLKLFRFDGGTPQRLIDQNIDSVSFVQKNGALAYMRGSYVESLCDSCDGWEASDPDDLFFIPIVIDVKTMRVRVDLGAREKEALRSRLNLRVAQNIADQQQYGNRTYAAFAKAVKERIAKVLDSSDGDGSANRSSRPP